MYSTQIFMHIIIIIFKYKNLIRKYCYDYLCTYIILLCLYMEFIVLHIHTTIYNIKFLVKNEVKTKV